MLQNNMITMPEVYKAYNTQMGAIIFAMAEVNTMFLDCPYMQMNYDLVHKVNVTASMPEVHYRDNNEAIPSGKSVTEQRTFTTARFESKSEMDEMAAEVGGPERLRFNRWYQGKQHVQAHSQALADLFIDGSPTRGDDPNYRKVKGFNDYLHTKNPDVATSEQIVVFDSGAANTDALTSIYLVFWGPQACHGIYDKGSYAGLRRIDHGKQMIVGKIPTRFGSGGGEVGSFQGYREQFITSHGLVVADTRQVGRITDIKTGGRIKLQPGFVDNSATNTLDVQNILDAMIQLTYQIESLQNGRGVWYCNRTIMQALHRTALQRVTTGGGLNFMNYGGQMVSSFLGFPIRQMDAIPNTQEPIATT